MQETQIRVCFDASIPSQETNTVIIAEKTVAAWQKNLGVYL
ncbi:MAG: hypothetical protein ABI472_18920 [Ginsengibacter sp.]